MRDDFLNLVPAKGVKQAMRRTRMSIEHAFSDFYRVMSDCETSSERTLRAADRYIDACKEQKSYYEQCKRIVSEDKDKSEKELSENRNKLNEIQSEKG